MRYHEFSRLYSGNFITPIKQNILHFIDFVSIACSDIGDTAYLFQHAYSSASDKYVKFQLSCFSTIEGLSLVVTTAMSIVFH